MRLSQGTHVTDSQPIKYYSLETIVEGGETTMTQTDPHSDFAEYKIVQRMI